MEKLLPFCVAIIAIAIGAAFALTGQEICQHHCWLDVAADFVLPTAFDAYSGGLPWIIVGLVLAVHAARRH